MRRLFIAAMISLVVTALPVFGQRGGRGSAGGGHASGGMHSGAGMGARGFSGGGSRAFSGRTSDQSFGRFSGRPVSQSSGSRSSSNFSNNFSRNRSRGLRGRGFEFGNGFGSRRGRIGYPWGYAGFYDPYWWWDSGSSYDEDRTREMDQANQMNAQSLDEQRMRRDEGQDENRPRDSQPRDQARSEAAEPATVLVFRDKRKQEVQNYAIVGRTLWSFSGPRTQKIPISDLDLAATAKANDERGVDFKVPAGGM
jgi:hypothetical protein